MPTLGLKTTLSPASYVLTQSSTRQQVAVDTTKTVIIPSGGWVTHLGVWARIVTGTPKLSLALWVNGALLARTDPLLVGAGGNVEGPVSWTNPTILGGLPSAVRLNPGAAVYLGWVISDGEAEIGRLSAPNVSFTRRNVDTPLPTNPFGSGQDVISQPPAAIYCTFVDSTKPTITLTSPASGASMTNDAPTLEANVTDIDSTRGDLISSYDVELRVNNAATNLWAAHFLASASEQLAAHITRPYAGPDLTGGVTYQWRMRAQDMTGEWSDWTAYLAFTISNIGIVDISTTAVPTGKVDGNSAAISWQARWWHTQNLAADMVQVLIETSAGVALMTGPQIAKAIAAADQPPGTAFTVTAVQAGIGALPYGQSLQWRIRARASNGVWSGYSEAVPFQTNALPTTPLIVSPANKATSTSRLTLVVASRDADADDNPLTDVVWTFEITEKLTSTVRTVVADTYDPVLGRASIKLTPTQVPNEGIYTWRARGQDVSAGDFGYSAWSAVSEFTFGAGPVVTMTNPAEGETQFTLTPRIDWETDDIQTAYELVIYPLDASGGRLTSVITTGKVASANTFYDVPAGKLVKGTTYEILLSSWDEGDLQGAAPSRRFLVQFGAIEGLVDVLVSVVARAGDVEPTTPVITWIPTKYPTSPSATGQFVSYLVKRWSVAQGPSASAVTLREVTNAAQIMFFDHHAPPNEPLVYAVSQRVKLSTGAIVESAETTAQVTIALTTPVIVAINGPDTWRFPVMWLGDNLAGGIKRRRSTYQTWGTGGVPTAASAPGGQKLRQCSFTILSDDVGSLRAHRSAIEALVASGSPVSWRDEYERIFMDVVDYSFRRGRLGQIEVALSLEQIAYREGV